ncbi:MAG TPA: hypothetical protein VN039_10465 [Nitrospira sp.]|nr:hypothetical protein [Nitrospira sp.]
MALSYVVVLEFADEIDLFEWPACAYLIDTRIAKPNQTTPSSPVRLSKCLGCVIRRFRTVTDWGKYLDVKSSLTAPARLTILAR